MAYEKTSSPDATIKLGCDQRNVSATLVDPILKKKSENNIDKNEKMDRRTVDYHFSIKKSFLQVFKPCQYSAFSFVKTLFSQKNKIRIRNQHKNLHVVMDI
jgi:hypothetical protein